MTLSLTQAEFLSGLLGFLFTVALFSYLLGDNPLYRLALHTFIGVAAGYAGVVIIYQVLQPRMIVPLIEGDTNTALLMVVPLILVIFLVLKISPRTASLGNISIAYLVGVGSAVAVGGALMGTLLPQIQATWLSVFPDTKGIFINNLIIIVGTVTTLLTFQFWLRGQTARGDAGRGNVMRVLTTIGQGFLVITLGVIYGGMILSGIAIFGERLAALVGFVSGLMP
jgi:hypothetical protein